MDLELKAIATKYFDFLKNEFGFKCVKSGTRLVQYKTDTVFVNIHFDGDRSYEFACEIGRLDDLRGSLNQPFDLGEIIRSKGLSENNIRSAFQVTSGESFAKFAAELSNNLKYYASEFLVGSSDAFNRVADFRDIECKEYAIETNLKMMRSQLIDYWKNRNYKKVIELLMPLKDNLENSELMKLNYAMKKEGQGKRK